MKIKVKSKEYQLIVKLKTSRDELIDSKELDRFSRIYLRGFLKPKLIKKNLIEYTGPVGASLYDRLKKPISKRDFLFIIEQIVIAVQKLNANNFALNRMVMSVQNVYMNEITKEVQFLYVPLENLQNTSNIIEFIESIVYLVKPADERDAQFHESKDSIFNEKYIVFVTDSNVIRTHPLTKYISIASHLGFTFVFFEQYEENIPQGCAEIIRLNGETNGGILKTLDGENIANVV